MFSPVYMLGYIDPASGHALIYLIIGIVCSVAFFMKGLFYKIFHRKNKSIDKEKSKPTKTCGVKAVKNNFKIAIFSEGTNYWMTYKPIIEGLIEKKQDFCYYSMDIHDPALTIENQFIHSKYIGSGARGYRKINKITNPILITTTPNFGSPGFPVVKSPYVQRLIHIFHSVTDITPYKKYSLDAYDAVYLGGEFQRNSILELECKRDLNPKDMPLVGLPYLDSLTEELKKSEYTISKNTDKPTVLIGSSWGKKGCLPNFGIGFVKLIADADYNVIIRPHPQSYISEPDLIRNFEKELATYTNIVWDNEISPTKSLAVSDVLISDASSIRFDYAFLHKKPVISLEIPPIDMEEYEYAEVTESESSLTSMNDLIGYSIKNCDTSKLLHLINKVLKEFKTDKLEQIRDDTICNFGTVGKAVAEELIRDGARLESGGDCAKIKSAHEYENITSVISRQEFLEQQKLLQKIHDDLQLIKKRLK